MDRLQIVGAGILAGALLLFLWLRFRCGKKRSSQALPPQDEFLLEEAEISRPVAPGLIGQATIAASAALVEVPVKAADPAQAFARGTRVRVIDYSGDCYIVEPAEEEHQVR